MFKTIALTTGWLAAQSSLPYQVEQLPIEETTVLFSSPNFVLALVAGVLMAVAFQLLFANLAIAVVAAPDSPAKDDDNSDLGDTIRGVELKLDWHC